MTIHFILCYCHSAGNSSDVRTSK